MNRLWDCVYYSALYPEPLYFPGIRTLLVFTAPEHNSMAFVAVWPVFFGPASGLDQFLVFSYRYDFFSISSRIFNSVSSYHVHRTLVCPVITRRLHGRRILAYSFIFRLFLYFSSWPALTPAPFFPFTHWPRPILTFFPRIPAEAVPSLTCSFMRTDSYRLPTVPWLRSSLLFLICEWNARV